MEIPPEFEPHPAQIPSYVETDADLVRFRVCFAIARLVTTRECDPLFVRELYFSDLTTDDEPPAPVGQLEMV